MNYRYRGERTFVVVPGLNHPKYVDLSKVQGLKYTEERMFFFLFLLKYKNTKIVYVTTKGFNKDLFNYYVGLISEDEADMNERLKRLVHIEVDNKKNMALVHKVLDNPGIIEKIKNELDNPERTVLRTYNVTEAERELAIKLGVPLFGSGQKFDFIGTKSGARKMFRLAKANTIPGFEDIMHFNDLIASIVKLIKKYPNYKKLMIKRNYSSSGKGNCIVRIGHLLEDHNVDSVRTDSQKLEKIIKANLKDYMIFQKEDEVYADYVKKFNQSGGIIELYIPGQIKYSPSTQVLINADKKARIVSTHEQILGGPDNQLFLGCKFPTIPSHRRLIIKEGEKIANVLAQKGIIGNFAIDYVVVYDKNHKNPIVWPIEINLRKGGTTHPFRTAFFLTGAIYNPTTGNLMSGKTPIHYYAMDFIEDQKYRQFNSEELINLVKNSKISFNKETKQGVLLYITGMLEEYGRFGAICIGQSAEEAEEYYKKMIKVINQHLKKSGSSR